MSEDMIKGKFQAFRIESEDTVLKDFLAKQCAKKATYLSKTSQNNLFECMRNDVSTKIVDDVKASDFFDFASR